MFEPTSLMVVPGFSIWMRSFPAKGASLSALVMSVTDENLTEIFGLQGNEPRLTGAGKVRI
jgi:hypothetical protein